LPEVRKESSPGLQFEEVSPAQEQVSEQRLQRSNCQGRNKATENSSHIFCGVKRRSVALLRSRWITGQQAKTGAPDKPPYKWRDDPSSPGVGHNCNNHPDRSVYRIRMLPHLRDQ